ncbi:TIGR03960 family B12-binding radical SAM protein [Thermodesulfobacteriota bacterium]
MYREMLAKEKGAIRKDWGGRISVALVYPNSYHVGMSSLGFQTIYSLLNRREDVVAERVFLPGSKETYLYSQSGRGLLSLESQSMIQRFDIVAFSLSFENDYPNILKILQLGKIPLLAEERDDSNPLIMAGGITTFLNPEPLAQFFDLFLIGEVEETLNEFIGLFYEKRKEGAEKYELTLGLAREMRSIYVPSLYEVVYNQDGTISARKPLESNIPEKIIVSHLKPEELPVNISPIRTPGTEFKDKAVIELGRGCGRSCRFCAAGYVYRPPRYQQENKLLLNIEKTLQQCRHIGLLSASVLDTPGIRDLTTLITGNGASFSVSSLRADLLTPEILDDIKKSGQKSLAIAPEAGSERLRSVINKHLTHEQISNAVRMIARAGDFTLRLYFLIGLPTETMDDVTQILELVKSIKHNMIKESKGRGSIGRISLSVNCFVPKAFTPFQWFPMEDVSELKSKQKWLKKALSKEGGVSVNFDVPKWTNLQTLLATGDRRVGSLLLLAHKQNGNWLKAFRYSELNPDFFVYRPRGLDEILPWDFIDHGINKEFLKKEYELALKGKESNICDPGRCEKCGVCKL